MELRNNTRLSGFKSEDLQEILGINGKELDNTLTTGLNDTTLEPGKNCFHVMC